MSRIAYVNGVFGPLEDAKVSVLDRGFLFGDGIYEVTAVVGGKLVDFEGHVARLWRSLGEIELASPVDEPALRELHHEMIRRNKLDEGMIYLEITRGAAEREFSFPKEAKPTLVMFTMAKDILGDVKATTGIKVLSVPDLRWERRDIKSVAMLAQVLAKQAAAKAGCGEAWMIQDGFVTEGGSSTAFIINKDGNIITRPLSNAILPGITRKAVLALAREHDLMIEERPFTIEEAYDATEAFITSATSFVMPVVEIDGKRVGGGQPGPLTRRLRELYLDIAKAD